MVAGEGLPRGLGYANPYVRLDVRQERRNGSRRVLGDNHLSHAVWVRCGGGVVSAEPWQRLGMSKRGEVSPARKRIYAVCRERSKAFVEGSIRVTNSKNRALGDVLQKL